MGWFNDLFETYENNISQAGEFDTNQYGNEYTLLPIGHTTQNAHIEVTIDLEGQFYDAKVVDSKEASTVIPATENSASRAGQKPPPHPLHDKLQYVACDFEEKGGRLKKGFTPYEDYMSYLKKWVSSPHSNERVEKVFNYLKNNDLIEDLVRSNVLVTDEKNELILKWDRTLTDKYGGKPDIFNVVTEQDKAFVRFDTYKPGQANEKLWRDPSVYEDFIRFYEEQLPQNDLCYVTGRSQPKTEKHMGGVRRSGDSAKLISAKDDDGYKYKNGRLFKSERVVSLSYEASQKAHNALKWLIAKQGKTVDERVFLVWGTKSVDALSPQEDSRSLLGQIKKRNAKPPEAYTGESLAREFKKALDGYRGNLTNQLNRINIIILDAATTGRLSVVYYRTLNEDDYIKRIMHWHQTSAWRHRFKKDNEFFGAPSTYDIAQAAFGARADKKLIKNMMERLIPCIIDGQNVPVDIVRNLINRASNPVAMDVWEWEKVLSITCSLVRKQYEKEEYEVALDTENNQRDYLFGRLLAIADVLERKALSSNRSTNAIRYMNAFARHPEKTWAIIQSNLQPYQARLGGSGVYYSRLIDEVASRFEIEEFTNKPLSGLYLLGFYSQRNELYKSKEEKQKETIASE